MTFAEAALPEQQGVDFLAGGGEMGALMRSMDWGSTRLGPTATWPQNLKTIVGTFLSSRFPILVWWGPELVMLYNDAYRPILGEKHPTSMGQVGCECWPELWPVIGPRLVSVLSGAGATWAEDTMLPIVRNGFAEECYFTFCYSPIRGQAGGIDGVLCSGTETTSKVLGQRRLRVLRDLASTSARARDVEGACRSSIGVLRGASSSVPCAAIYALDPSLARATLVDSTTALPEVFPEALGDHTRWPITAALRTREATWIHEVPGLPRGGWLTPASKAVVLPLAPALDESPFGVLIAAASAGAELTDDYRAFFELVARQVILNIVGARAYDDAHQRAAALAEIERAKTVFLADTSHALRTPLVQLLAPVETLRSAELGPLTCEQRTQVELLHRTARRLVKLVNTLVELSRIDAGRACVDYQATDVAALTATLASAFRALVERAGVELIIDCGSPVLAYVDRAMWEKIVLHLISNALKFTLRGRIRVAVCAAGEAIELRVTDTGIGIPKCEHDRIFERFHRVPGAQGRCHEGSGVGLALVQELVALHDGVIEVASAVGQGTSFRVSLPRGDAHLPRALEPRLEVSPSTSTVTAFLEEAQRWVAGQETP